MTTNTLLQPDEVREMQRIIDDASLWPYEKTPRLLADYLTLWDTLEAMNDRTEKMLTTLLAAFEEGATEQREGLERFRQERNLYKS